MLFVCTGNICRSPMAEQMLKANLQQSGVTGVTVESAGTWAMVGENIPKPGQDAMIEAGLTPMPHSARQLDADLLREANLVLTATEEHRAEAVRTFVKANRYTFTIGEFARLAAFVENPEGTEFVKSAASGLTEKLQLVASARGYVEDMGDINLEDPYGLDIDAYRATRQQLTEDIEVLGRWLADA